MEEMRGCLLPECVNCSLGWDAFHAPVKVDPRWASRSTVTGKYILLLTCTRNTEPVFESKSDKIQATNKCHTSLGENLSVVLRWGASYTGIHTLSPKRCTKHKTQSESDWNVSPSHKRCWVPTLAVQVRRAWVSLNPEINSTLHVRR